jgi:excisionase family DNA binding protein
MPADLLNINEVAKRLSVSPAAVRRWIAQRRVPVVKLGALTRLRAVDVNDMVRQGLPAPGSYPRPLNPRGRARVEDAVVLTRVPQSQLDHAS